MARPSSAHPTELELEILKILWQDGPRTADALREALATASRARDLTHSSVSTVVKIMVRKQYIQRTKRGRSFVYEARVTEKETNRGMLGDLVDRVFEGSATTVVLELLETKDLDAEELQTIRRMINQKRRET